MHQHLSREAIIFTKKIFKAYLEDRNVQGLKGILHDNISGFGTGAHELYNNKEDILKLLKAEKNSWDIHFKIVKDWLKAVPISENIITVYGTMNIVEDGQLNTILVEMEFRFSLTLILTDEGFKITHIHCSVPDIEQNSDEYVHKTIVNDYNLLLEKKLEERTRLLSDRTAQLQYLADNICGGIQVCKCDKKYTVIYISDGFTELTGYTMEDMEEKNYSHIALVHPEDLHLFSTEEVIPTIGIDPKFTLEYRIIKKDGSIIWVLDNGTIFSDRDGCKNYQCILTDITKQKDQEKSLKLSEKRYEVALRLSDITMFEYNILTRQLILFGEIAESYNISRIVENGPETFMKQGIILAENHAVYREMYRKIDNGEPFGKCTVKTHMANGEENYYELSLTTVYDSDGIATSAIGVRKNISNVHYLQKEHAFGKSLMTGKHFVFEADIDTDTVSYLNTDWYDDVQLINTSKYSHLIKEISEKIISPNNAETFLHNLSKDNITAHYNNDINVLMVEYLRKAGNNTYAWHEDTINIIKDNISGNISIRLYSTNINSKKIKEQRAMEEQLLYETMIAKASVAYQINVSQNIVVSGHEQLISLYGINYTSDYTLIINTFAKVLIYKDDTQNFLDTFNRSNLISSFNNNIKELTCHYRKLSDNNKYLWVSCTLHMYEDPTSDDIKGFAYVEDINEKKESELALLYAAQHDNMTGLYNKNTAQELIDDYLSHPETQDKYHAFLMIDLDFFKDINDNFGHHFGDAVITDVSNKIRSTFRVSDIVGRIGGDEFCVFLKNANNLESVKQKCEEVRKNLINTYTNNEISVEISCSIGIAIYGLHGTTFDDLYIHSDAALYNAKDLGRNRYSL